MQDGGRGGGCGGEGGGSLVTRPDPETLHKPSRILNASFPLLHPPLGEKEDNPDNKLTPKMIEATELTR